MIKEPDLTESERFMASYVPNVCDGENCDVIQGLCDECYRFLKRAGNELDEFIKKHKKTEWEEFCKQLPKAGSKEKEIRAAWDKECEKLL